MNPHLAAALKLHQYLVDRHWDGRALVGPDPGVRFNYRIGRFVKSYLPFRSWNDGLCYLQGQGYWVLANWDLYARTHDSAYRDVAVHCSEGIAVRQRDDGAWDYPNPEWTGRVATVEGIWASLGLLETFRWTGDERYLRAVLQWHEFLIEKIGFQQRGDELAINYFAARVGGRIPNNSTDALRFLAELAQATGQRSHLQPCAGLLEFVRHAQAATGELPYAVQGSGGDSPRPHFQCYQYNAFQCLGLMRYYELTADAAAIPIILGVLAFLSTGIASDGRVFYECGNKYRFVTYHAAVVGAAFAKARALGLGSDDALADRTLSSVLRVQNRDGGCPYSCGDYRILRDRRSYPRYLAITLVHLLTSAQPGTLAELESRCASRQ
jgi:hypothetical protein